MNLMITVFCSKELHVLITDEGGSSESIPDCHFRCHINLFHWENHNPNAPSAPASRAVLEIHFAAAAAGRFLSGEPKLPTPPNKGRWICQVKKHLSMGCVWPRRSGHLQNCHGISRRQPGALHTLTWTLNISVYPWEIPSKERLQLQERIILLPPTFAWDLFHKFVFPKHFVGPAWGWAGALSPSLTWGGNSHHSQDLLGAQSSILDVYPLLGTPAAAQRGDGLRKPEDILL